MTFTRSLNVNRVKLLKLLTFSITLKVKSRSKNQNLTEDIKRQVVCLNSFIDLLEEKVREHGMYPYAHFYNHLRNSLNRFISMNDLYEMSDAIELFLEKNRVKDGSDQQEGTIIEVRFKKD